MEPSEFDQIIQQKLKQPNTAHQQNMEDSKAAIWAKIQPKTNKKAIIIPWYYSAAAVVLVLFGSSVVFYKMDQNYQNELEMLSAQLKVFKTQSVIASTNDSQINQLCAKIDRLEWSKYKKQPQQIIKEVIIQKQLVYKTDTIFLKQTEYIVQNAPKIPLEKNTLQNINDSIQMEKPIPSRAIFFDSEEDFDPKNNNSTALRIKLGNFKNN